MKIAVPVVCSCGTEFMASGVGEEDIPPATCPKCSLQIHILDPLSVSVVADRLLYRAQQEAEKGDYTLSIICSAIAVEAVYTQAFTKWKGIAHLQTTSQTAGANETESWGTEYRNQTRGSFERSSNLVAQFLVGSTFDDFVAGFLLKSGIAALIKVGFPPDESSLKLNHIYMELFRRRNRNMHWGQVDYQEADARAALKAGWTAFAILKDMDRERYEAMERVWRERVREG